VENWANRKTLIPRSQQMVGLLTPPEYNDALKQPIACTARALLSMDPKGTHRRVPLPGEWRLCPLTARNRMLLLANGSRIREREPENYNRTDRI